MRCPRCKRPTVLYVRVDGVKVKPKDAPEGSFGAALADGTCWTCRREETGKRRASRPERPEMRHFDDREIERCRRDHQRLVQRRRARGVPDEGLDPSVLVKPGLFTAEVR